MSYQSEAQLEHQLIENLVAHGYERVIIPDMETLESNFRKILNLFNKGNLKGKDLSDKEFERVMLEINGKSVFQSAKQLRDKFTITRDDGTSIYLSLFDSKDYTKNKIALSPADVDGLQREEDKKAFIVAFRELSKVLMVLETFIEFDFDFSIDGISHQEYEDFRSKWI